MDVIATFFHYLLYALGIFLFLNCVYLLFFALAGHKKINAISNQPSRFRKFCVLIPAYRENVVILESSMAALQHAYSGKFEVVVIADGLKSETVLALRLQGAQVVEVSFEKSTKGKALAVALNELQGKGYEVAAVLDVDNIMGKGFLEEVNRAFEAGYKVVQAHRTAKNMDTSFALLDTCNEEINNHIYRKGHFAVGLSSALIGSGMAFDFNYLQKLLVGIGDTVGEDKEIDFRIAKDQVKICYLDKVYVYDEKIENAQVFTQQRTRWISAQLEFLKKYSKEGLVQLFRNGNFEFFNKVLQAYLVPRMLLIGLLGLLFLISFVLPVGPPVSFWFVLLVMLAAALLISLPQRLYNKNLWQAIIRLPYAIFCMVIALFGINKTKTSFLATPHKSQSISTKIDT